MKILCPFHEENTPSCHLYPDGYSCFGCGKRGPLTDLDLPEKSKALVKGRGTYYQQENLVLSIDRIRKLPTKLIRGIELPYDDSGYYIVYPGDQYYTKRLLNPSPPSDKYRGPKGHKKPLMVLNTQPGILFVVEGQLNALSLNACLDSAIVSPGSANDLNRKEFIQFYLRYDHICVIVDEDPAGVVCGIALRDELLRHKKDVVLLPLKRDLNDIYVEENGQEAIVKTIKGALELFTRL